ncbi:MAG: hypothetical protein ACI4L7_02405 [Christensenellales bacterium]
MALPNDLMSNEDIISDYLRELNQLLDFKLQSKNEGDEQMAKIAEETIMGILKHMDASNNLSVAIDKAKQSQGKFDRVLVLLNHHALMVAKRENRFEEERMMG